jgi:hypothetical protein
VIDAIDPLNPGGDEDRIEWQFGTDFV